MKGQREAKPQVGMTPLPSLSAASGQDDVFVQAFTMTSQQLFVWWPRRVYSRHAMPHNFLLLQ